MSLKPKIGKLRVSDTPSLRAEACFIPSTTVTSCNTALSIQDGFGFLGEELHHCSAPQELATPNPNSVAEFSWRERADLLWQNLNFCENTCWTTVWAFLMETVALVMTCRWPAPLLATNCGLCTLASGDVPFAIFSHYWSFYVCEIFMKNYIWQWFLKRIF